MIRVYIAGTQYTDFFDFGSLTLTEQIQNKASTLTASLRPGVYTLPSQNQEILVYDTVEIISVVGAVVTVKDKLQSGLSLTTYGKYRVGEYFWLDIGTSNLERGTIASIADPSGGQIAITLETAPTGSFSAGDVAGKLIFGGTLTGVTQSNPKLLTDVEVALTATDFTKIFDKRNINDSWANFTARQVINDALNTTINYNLAIDEMEYASNGAIQAEYTEANDGSNPLSLSSSIIQGSYAGQFPWVFGAGNAQWTGSPTATDLSDLLGVTSGQPTKGNLKCWVKSNDPTQVTSIKIRIGSDGSNYSELTITVPTGIDTWEYRSVPFSKVTPTGTPVWTATDYLQIRVVETGSGNISLDDIRVEANGSFTMYNFEDGDVFDDVRASFKKPTYLIDDLAKAMSYFWFIDYERDIHFFQQTSNFSPFDLADTSNNFDDLRVDIDGSQIKNVQVVRGGTETSTNYYTQVVQGDNAVREWILKSQFSGLLVYFDNNTSTDTTEAGTNTTTINATAHGLSSGDYIVNRTRSNAVRQITVTSVNQFTVEAVTGQTSGDTFSKFATAKTVGVEFLTDESTVDYVSNFQEKTIRASAQTTTLTSSDFLLFKYKEIVPIRVIARDNSSIAALKALVGGDGLFEGAVITDNSLDTRTGAVDRARTEIRQYSNPIVKLSFTTNYEGLHAGQLITIVDTNKGINDAYMIQKVATKYKTLDFPTFSITCASSLFGIVEYFQKIARQNADKSVDDNELIDQIASEYVIITVAEVNSITTPTTVSENVTSTEAEADYINSPPTWVAGQYHPTSLLLDRKRPMFADRDNLLRV